MGVGGNAKFIITRFLIGKRQSRNHRGGVGVSVTGMGRSRVSRSPFEAPTLR